VRSRPAGREIQCHIFLDAQFFEIRAIFSGREIQFQVIRVTQFFRARAIVLFVWCVDYVNTVATHTQNLGKSKRESAKSWALTFALAASSS
jgi:hypothetical protein